MHVCMTEFDGPDNRYDGPDNRPFVDDKGSYLLSGPSNPVEHSIVSHLTNSVTTWCVGGCD